MFYELFILFGIAWWAMMIVGSIIIIACLENETAAGATATAIVALALWFFLGDLGAAEEGSGLANKFDWTKLAIFIGVYFAGGVFWSVFKWWRFATNRLDKYKDIRKEWLHDRGIDSNGSVPDELKDDWTEHIKSRHLEYTRHITKPGSNRRELIIDIKVYAKNYKGKIATWMTYWPWSFIWFVLDDLVQAAWRRIQRAISGILDSISRTVFSKAENDFNNPE